MDDQTGRTLHGYEIFDRVGSGGFGVVYRAFQSTLGREVALKIILPGYANRPEFIRRFEVEAQLIARLEHLHIVPLYDFWRDPSGAYLVTRLLKGGNLKQALESGPFDLKAISLLLDQIASGLSYAHANGVIHRDVKPANILLDEEGNAYLTDFGIALDIHRGEDLRAREDLSSDYQEFISPELVRNEPVSPQSDIYNLGLVLYEALAGQPAFPNASPVERMFRHLNDPLPQIDSLHPEICEGVNTVIQKATAKNPAHRYRDAVEMAAAFRSAAKLGDDQPVNVFEVLTLREQGILEGIVAGRTNREIAQELFVELSTVKWYVRQIYRKLGVRSRRQAVVRAKESGLFSRTDQPGSIADDQADNTRASVLAPGNPYKGLRPFEVADARDFFGREALVRKLLDRLAQTWKRGAPPGNGRFLAVVGPSGSGKSSLIKAGFIPALMAGGVNGSDRWFIAQMEPGPRPLDQLEVALVRLAAERAGDLRAQLERDQFGLVRAAGLILPQDGSELVLVVDQFEEIFTLTAEESDRVRYLDLMSAAALEPNSRVRTVIVLRADFYDRPLTYPVFGELVRSSLETVLPLSAEELERAILAPSEQCGVSFEPGLAAKIIEDVFYQPGALPMLQYALTELFEQREGLWLTQVAYQKIGGATGALAQRAEELYLEMDAHGRMAIQQIFLRLVTFGEEAGAQQAVYIRRRAQRAELLGLADKDLIDEILDTFSRYRLLSLDHEPGTRRPTVELAHEALFSKWERLQNLLDESREDLYTQRRLSALAAEWEQSGRDPGYLLRSSRLDQFAGWSAHTKLALTVAERSFLETSLAERKARQEEEATRREREIETARQLAETEGRRAHEQARTSRRLRWLASGLAVLLIAALGAGWFALGQRRIAQQNEASAEHNAVLADQNAATAVAARAEAIELADLRSRDAQVNQSLALAAQSRLALQSDNLDLALALAWEAVQIPDPPGRAQMALSEAAYAPGTIRVFLGHADPVWSVAVSPDGRYGLSGDAAGLIYLWDLESGAALRKLEGHQGLVSSLAFTPDGRRALSGSHDRTILYWDLESGQILRRLEGHQAMVNGLAVSPDGRTAASGSGRNAVTTEDPGSKDNSIRVWDLENGEEIQRYAFFSDGVTGVSFTPDGRQLAIGTITEGFWLLDLETGKALIRSHHAYGFDDNQMTAVAVSQDGRTAVTADGFYNEVEVWDLLTGEASEPPLGHSSALGDKSTLYNVAIRPDGRRALAGSVTVIEWDTQTGELVYQFNFGANAVAYLPGGTRALIGSQDHSLRLLALGSGAEISRFSRRTEVAGVAYSPDGRAALMNNRFELQLWDLETGAEIWTRVTEYSWANKVAFSPDGQLVLVSGCGVVTLYDTQTGEVLQHLESDGSFVGHLTCFGLYEIAFHPGGKFALTSSVGAPATPLIYWDLESGKPVWLFDTTVTVLGVAISPDGRTALSAHGEDNSVNWWDLETGLLLRRLEGHTNIVWDVEYLDDRTAISASEDSTLILWDLESGAALRSFLGHAAAVKRVVVSPDRRLALSASRDGTAILWDVHGGEPLRRYAGHTGELFDIAWHPDGEEALSGGGDNQAIRWRIDAELETFLDWVEQNRYVRELTCTEREAFHVEPLCEGETSAAETGAPPSVAVSGSALLPKLPLSAATPIPLQAAPARFVEAGAAAWGGNHGSIEAGGGQAWEYAGEAGERLSILVAADRPVNHIWSVESQLKDELLDPVLAVYSPDGSLLAATDDLENGISTDAYLADIALPLTGIYRVEVRSYRDRTGGGYRLFLGKPRPMVFQAGVRTTGGLAITPDGKSALVGVGQDPLFINPADDNRIWVWDLESGEAIHRLEGHQNTPINLAVSPVGRQLLSGSVDGVAILWDLEIGEEIRRFKIADIEISGIRFHPDGRTALVATFEPGLMLLDLASGEVIRRFEGHQGLIPDLALSADGKTAYSTSFDGTLRTWDVDSGEVLAVFEPFDGSPANGLALSPDGNRLLVGGGDAFARHFEPVSAPIALVDARTGERLLDLEGHNSVVKSVAFSPDGRYALSGSRDTTVRLWDLTTGESLVAFAGHTQEVWKVAFSPDGRTGFSTSRDGSFRVWDLNAYIGNGQTGSP